MFSRFSRVALFFMMGFLAVAIAMPGGYGDHPVTTTVTVTPPASTPTPASSCSTSGLQCCNSVESAGSAAGSLLLSLLGIVVQDVNVLLGVDCSPITVLGLGQGGCSAQAVCCQNNAVGGLISIGCIPVSL